MTTQEVAPTTEQVREFVIAGHGNLDRVKQMLAENPQLLSSRYQWNENDFETAIQAAAQMGNKPIAEFLLEKGAPIEICTAAMLGRRDEVERRLNQDASQAKAAGAHNIPLLAHAALSDDPVLVRFVFGRGATLGANLALHNAILKGNSEIVQWLLDTAKPDINAKNYQGKTPLRVAVERKDEKIAKLLASRGATE